MVKFKYFEMLLKASPSWPNDQRPRPTECTANGCNVVESKSDIMMLVVNTFIGVWSFLNLSSKVKNQLICSVRTFNAIFSLPLENEKNSEVQYKAADDDDDQKYAKNFVQTVRSAALLQQTPLLRRP